MSKTATLEVANISQLKPFSNTLDWDCVLYTSSNSQTVQIGCGVDSSRVSTLTVSASNIGVKTATPANALDVNGWIRAYGSAAQNGIISTNTLNSGYSFYQCFGDFGSGLIMFQNGSTRADDGGAYTATIRNDIGDLRLMASTGTGIIVKSATGNVGIGNTSPSVPLEVSGCISSIAPLSGTAFQGLNANMAANGFTQIAIGKTTSTYSNAAVIKYTHVADWSVNNMAQFGVWGANNITCLANGNVGIGTTSPTTALQVSGTVNATTLQMASNEVITVAGGKTITGNLTVAGTLSGNGSGISNLSGSAIGSGTVSASYLPAASLSTAGIVRLENSTGSSLTDRAASANAVRLAYERADSAKSTADQAKSTADSVSSSIGNMAQMFSGSWSFYSSHTKFGIQFYTSAQGLYWGGVPNGWYGDTRFLIYLPSTGLYTINTIVTWFSGGATRRLYCSQFVKLEYMNSVQKIVYNSNKLGENLSLSSDVGNGIVGPYTSYQNLYMYSSDIPANISTTWNISVFKECIA